MMIHFVIDEKIIDQIIDNFLEISDDNIFLVFTTKTNNKFTYITSQSSSVKRFNYINEDINEVLSTIEADGIILHQLNKVFAKVINKLKCDIKIAWIVWGFDIYSLPKVKPSLFAPNTKKYINRNRPTLPIVWFIKKHKYLRFLLYKLKCKPDPFEEVFRAIEKIDFFCTYMQEDYVFFAKYYQLKNLTFFESAFSTIDQYLAGNKNLRINDGATNIIVGNSKTFECNYLDVFPILAKNKDRLDEVYIVLSYGNKESHEEKVIISEGKRQLGAKSHPLTDFMPREQYVEMLQSCSVGIFNHYRQQAMGNIIALLYLGARVYLSERNPAYHYFLRKGIIVNSFENEFNKYLNTRLNGAEANSNRKQLDLIFRKEKVISDLSLLIQTLKS